MVKFIVFAVLVGLVANALGDMGAGAIGKRAAQIEAAAGV